MKKFDEIVDVLSEVEAFDSNQDKETPIIGKASILTLLSIGLLGASFFLSIWEQGVIVLIVLLAGMAIFVWSIMLGWKEMASFTKTPILNQIGVLKNIHLFHVDIES